MELIEAGVHRRLAAVEALIPPTPPWRSDDSDLVSIRAVSHGTALARGRRPTLGVVVAAIVVVALTVALALSAIGGLPSWGPQPTPTPGWAERFPVATTSGFERPFTYAIDPATGLELNSVRPQLLQFRVPDPTRPGGYARIVAVRIADAIRADACTPSGGATIESPDPEAFIAYLSAIPGLDFGPPVTTTIDGRAALHVDVAQRTDDACPDVYVWPGEEALTNTSAARRLIVLEVDGATIVITAAVADRDDFGAWLPAASGFIDSIHFVGAASPAP